MALGSLQNTGSKSLAGVDFREGLYCSLPKNNRLDVGDQQATMCSFVVSAVGKQKLKKGPKRL